MILPPWIWDPPTTDCHGAPEPAAVVSLLAQVLVEPAGFLRVCASDPETGDEVCRDEIQYAPPVLVQVDELVEATYPGDAVYTPAAGGVTFLELGAKDAAGNISGGPCE